jgi:DNA-binding PadR family transcriptional regulator
MVYLHYMGRKSIGWKNLWSLTVLVFLRIKPMHPYELRSVISLTHKDDFLPLNPGSLYNAIERLLEAELIEVAEKSRAGHRPERTVYRINSKGSEEMVAWLRELLQRPGPDTTWFYAALSFLPALEPKDARKQLQMRLTHLATEIRNYEQVLAQLTDRIGRLHLVEVEYALALRAAERRWVTVLIDDLRSGKLHWNREMLRKQAARFLVPALADQQKVTDARLKEKS